jgi:CBS domain-containing protein
MKIKEIMTRQLKSIPAGLAAKDAWQLLVEFKISGLPVLDKDNRLLGMFTEKDILAYILPSYVEKVGRFIYQEDSKAARKKFSALDNLKVENLMRKEVVTTTEEASLLEVARLMLTQKARRLPVLDASGRVSGMVSRADVLMALSKEAGIFKED